MRGNSTFWQHLRILANRGIISSMKSTHRYLPVNDAQRAWGLYATCAGHSQTRPGDEFPSSAHPDEYFFTWKKGRILHEWQFSLVEHGCGIVEFSGKRYSVNENTLIILPPGCWHRFRPDKSTGWTTFWIGLGGELAERLVGGLGIKMDGDVRDIPRSSEVSRLLADTVNDIIAYGFDRPCSMAARVLSLVATLAEESSSAAKVASTSGLVSRAQSHILEHATEHVDFAALAESLGVPYRTLRYMFAKETGTSLLQYQLETRLTRAKNLLRSTDMPIGEIASRLGFNSTWYFAHFFQKRVRSSPAAYRKKQKSRAAGSNPSRSSAGSCGV